VGNGGDVTMGNKRTWCGWTWCMWKDLPKWYNSYGKSKIGGVPEIFKNKKKYIELHTINGYKPVKVKITVEEI
jgi:hypothetical protein